MDKIELNVKNNLNYIKKIKFSILRDKITKKQSAQRMIPGKIFFESISVSQQLSKRYEIYLLLNGIYYDKIKLFQTKYLCLTVNDVLEVELGIKESVQQSVQNETNLRVIRNLQHLVQRQQKQQSYLKVLVPQTYKLLIESKTVEVKFLLNKKNRHQEIRVNLTFEPVTSFSRKKLGAPILSSKSATKNTTNRLAYFNDSQENDHNVFHFNQGDSINSGDHLFPQELNFNKNGQFSQLQSPISNHSKAQTIKHQNFMANKDNQERVSKQRGFSKQRNERLHGLNPQQQFSHTIKSQTFSDLFEKQVNTSRTYNAGTRENIKISQDLNQESIGGNQNQYQTEGNCNSSEAPSELDTLESLAYQREKILGQLFGKFSHRNKK